MHDYEVSLRKLTLEKLKELYPLFTWPQRSSVHTQWPLNTLAGWWQHWHTRREGGTIPVALRKTETTPEMCYHSITELHHWSTDAAIAWNQIWNQGPHWIPPLNAHSIWPFPKSHNYSFYYYWKRRVRLRIPSRHFIFPVDKRYKVMQCLWSWWGQNEG